MCDVHKEYFRQKKNVFKWAKHGFATTNLGEKRKQFMEWKHTDYSVKKKFWVQWS